MLRRSTIILPICLIAAMLPGQAIAQWSAPIQCSDSSKKYTYWQSYDFDASGKVHMVWQNWDDGTPNLYYATNASGSWTRSHINDGKSSFIVITKADQVLHFFYHNNDQVYERTKPVSGGSWSSPVRVDANPSGGYINDVIVDPYDGIYLSWGHLFDSGWNPPSGAYGRYKPFGGSWGPTEFIQGLTNDIWPQYLQLVPDGARIYASYRLTNTSNGARYKVREGGVWGPEKVVDSTAYGGNLAISPNGEMACVWGAPDPEPEEDVDWNIYCRLSGDGGATWGPAHVVMDNRSLCRSPLAVYDAHGNLYVGFEGRDNQYAKFSTYVRPRVGAVWLPPEIVNHPSGITPKALHINAGLLYCTYSSDLGVSGGRVNVYLRTRPISADYTPPAPVSGLSAVGGDNRVTLTWTNPADADYLATSVRASTSGFPASAVSGREVCVRPASPGASDSFTDYPLPASTIVYYSAFAQDSSGNWSAAAQASATTAVDHTPPADVTSFTATPYRSGALRLQWTNPTDIDFKGTMIRFKQSGYPTSRFDGTELCRRDAAPGSTDSTDHYGLTPGQTYFYTAFAYDKEANPNYSAGSRTSGIPVSQTCGYVRGLPDGSAVDLPSVVVSGIFPGDGYVYVQEADRSAGIRVSHSGSGLVVGDRVAVTGILATRVVSGFPSERLVTSAAVTKVAAGSAPAPIAVSCQQVGGGPIGSLPGVRDGFGLNNIGLLAKIAGRVTYAAGSYIYVDDGSGVPNLYGVSTPVVGVMVRCSSVPDVLEGDVVSAVGVIEGSVPMGWTTNRACIRARTAADVTVLSAAQP